MTDSFETYNTGLTSPIREAVAVIPSDSIDLTDPTRAVYIGGAGDLDVTMVSGQRVTFQSVMGGVAYPLRVARVWAAGTTATGIVGLR